ncbi:type I restriction-modification system endonuclease [Paenibacillus puerhi]|uniref:type I restriction-modification system endonuclease n=1 Tax=Paenibacillus puerhi TaxID=2692622 RepID=UPI0013569BF1|nr:type I restriction-modification system endonuclease [Paenibacillus puerhi]
MAGNFEFLESRWTLLSGLGEMAERNLYTDPNTSLIKLRMFGETLTKYICALEELDEGREWTQVERLSLLRREDLITEEIVDMLHTLRKTGNKAAHEAGYGSTGEAQALTRLAFRLGVWFMQVYGEWDFQAASYVEIRQEAAAGLEQLEQLDHLARSYERQMEQLQQELALLREQQTTISPETKKKRHLRSRQSGSAFALSEAETRLIIDEKLRQAGWEADSQTLRFGLGVRPEKGRQLAIAEWGLQNGYADYALFCGLELVGIVEAKRIGRQVEADIAQAKKYAMQVIRHGDEIIHGPWGNYQVPFLFSTNGRPYLEQLKQMSGIWFLDARKPTHHLRPLQAWYSPQGLKHLLQQDQERASQALQDETLDYLKLRPYQEAAIQSAERAIGSGERNILLAMATGTGKTRMAIGLIYRLIKHNRFKRILFLVDRSALGRQAEAAFKDSKLESYHSFTEIFELQTLDDKNPSPETKVQIATVQGMVKRLFYQEADGDIPSVDQYDCILVDEAHRGYTLDKEMSELELAFRDHEDYVSKYRKVLDYFDAVRIGLTATPALHTVEIFGRPVFHYSYREAVIDGYLIDHEPPMQFETELKKHGITWQIGEEIAVYDASSGQIDREVLEDEINLEVTQFNKSVITENFNRVILAELTKHIDPESEGKTLIFAATDDHADLVVRLFKEELEKVYGAVDDNAVMKITGSIKDPLHAIKLFKNERLPNIVVTVDLLTTGVDIPSITNLVFLRRVRSRILYEQMLGRATRRCDEIGKDHFMIYDAVGIYESLKPFTDMKPVVTRPGVSLSVLVDELAQIQSEEQARPHKDEILAKLQRKKRTWTAKDHEDFKALSGGVSIEGFIAEVNQASALQAGADLQARKSLIGFIDENRGRSHRIYISEHEDKLLSTTRGYGDARKPEDYLEGFHAFIAQNLNLIPALTIICTRPGDLTRAELRNLRIALDQHGYSEKALQAAWRDAKNEDVAADIISFIRQQALGDPLISHEERILAAMKKIYDSKVWSKVQKDWLRRIEKQLLQESVLDPNPEKAFDVEPFKSKGGYRQLNKIFDGEMDAIVTTINTALYTPRKREHA